MTVTGSARPLVLTGSVVGNPPLPDLVAAAVAAGYDGLSLWPAIGYGLGPDDRKIIDDAGLQVVDVDALVAWVGDDDPGAPYFEEAPPPQVWATAEALGAGRVNVLMTGQRGASPEQAAEVLAGIADEAARRGLRVTMEFARNTVTPNIGVARDVLDLAGRPNASLLVDVWHLHWTGGTPADVAATPGAQVGTVQLSDAPAERPADYQHATRYHREVPGDGVVDLGGLLRALDAIGSDAPLVVETFNQPLLDRHGVEGYAKLLADAVRNISGARPG
jgi:sugar phosphate isomerase/epimerase